MSLFCSEFAARIDGYFERWFDKNPSHRYAPRATRALQNLSSPSREITRGAPLSPEVIAEVFALLNQDLTPKAVSDTLGLPKERIRKMAWSHGYRYSVGAYPRRIDNLRKNSTGPVPLADGIVSTMYRRYKQCRSLERAAAEFSRTKQDLHYIFRRAGLPLASSGGDRRSKAFRRAA